MILDAEDEIEKLIPMRLARHSVLMRNHPPSLLAIINEQALRVPLGGADAPPVVFLENRSSSLFLEDKEDIRDHDAALEKLLTLALSTGESAQLLAELAYEACRDPREDTTDGSIDAGRPLMA